jgi:4-hydroxybenzoate polyprenyltransferase
MSIAEGPGVAQAAPPKSMLRAWLRLLRPRQMMKNVFCLAGVMFGPGRLTDAHAWVLDFATLVVFSFTSCSVYIFNDIIDRERDRLHPRKRSRPIASGAISVTSAAVTAVVLAAGALAWAWAIAPLVFVCVLLYLVNNVAYSLKLKHMALFDVLCIALGFLLRLLAGIYALGDLPTAWIALCSFFLTLFLGFSKRRTELMRLMPSENQQHRPVLSKYTTQFLDYLVNNTAVMTIMCYALFTASGEKNPSLVITVPIVFFAVMHYKRLVMLFGAAEEPEKLVLRDARLLVSILIWLICYLAIVHSNVELFR